jgi:hypothetical protein
MCPACITQFLTSSAVIAGSTGGLAAVVLTKIRVKNSTAKEKNNGK